MKDYNNAFLLACLAAVVILGVFTLGLGFGISYAREEYKTEISELLKENNMLLKEKAEWLKKLKEVVE